MTTHLIDRQYPLAMVVKTTAANVGAGNGYTFKLPVNALFLRALVRTETAFDGTTPTLTMGDGTTTFANGVDISSTGSETVSNVPKFYPSGGTISITLAGTDVTAGLGIVVAEYVILNRGGERAE